MARVKLCRSPLLALAMMFCLLTSETALTDCGNDAGFTGTDSHRYPLDWCSDLSITGPATINAVPGQYQYQVIGANGKVWWSVSGEGASIDQNGLVTVEQVEGVCVFTVGCSDGVCEATFDARKPGYWVWVDGCTADCNYYVGARSDCVSGKRWVINSFGGYPASTCGKFSCDKNCTANSLGIPSRMCIKDYSYCSFNEFEYQCY